MLRAIAPRKIPKGGLIMDGKALVAEFIGTFALVFVAVGAIAADYLQEGGSGLVGVALATGLTLVVMVSATAPISGGHINPAVTFGAWITGKIDTLNGIGYVIVQCLGAIAAAALIKVVMPANTLALVKMGTPMLGTGVTHGMGLLMEIVLTFLLVFVIFGTAIDHRAPKFGGLFIGLAVTMDTLVGGPITGAAMNPARHLGPALLGSGMENTWLYWVGPLIGSSLAAMIYHHALEE